MGKDTSVRTLAGQVIIIAFRLLVEIPVLVMNAEEVAQFFHGLRKLTHAFPSAGLHTSRADIRMLIVISGISPTVEVKVELLYSVRLKGTHLFRSFSKRNQTIILIRCILIKKFRIRLYAGLDPFMHKGSPD